MIKLNIPNTVKFLSPSGTTLLLDDLYAMATRQQAQEQMYVLCHAIHEVTDYACRQS